MIGVLASRAEDHSFDTGLSNQRLSEIVCIASLPRTQHLLLRYARSINE